MAKKAASKAPAKASSVEEKAPSADKLMLKSKKGKAKFMAAKGKALWVTTGPKKMVKIVDSDRVEINIEVMPYSAFNTLKKAVKDGDVILLGGGQ